MERRSFQPVYRQTRSLNSISIPYSNPINIPKVTDTRSNDDNMFDETLKTEFHVKSPSIDCRSYTPPPYSPYTPTRDTPPSYIPILVRQKGLYRF